MEQHSAARRPICNPPPPVLTKKQRGFAALCSKIEVFFSSQTFSRRLCTKPITQTLGLQHSIPALGSAIPKPTSSPSVTLDAGSSSAQTTPG